MAIILNVDAARIVPGPGGQLFFRQSERIIIHTLSLKIATNLKAVVHAKTTLDGPRSLTNKNAWEPLPSYLKRGRSHQQRLG